MNAIFADTFYWAALTNIDDPAKERALQISRSIAPDRMITTDEVRKRHPIPTGFCVCIE